MCHRASNKIPHLLDLCPNTGYIYTCTLSHRHQPICMCVWLSCVRNVSVVFLFAMCLSCVRRMSGAGQLCLMYQSCLSHLSRLAHLVSDMCVVSFVSALGVVYVMSVVPVVSVVPLVSAASLVSFASRVSGASGVSGVSGGSGERSWNLSFQAAAGATAARQRRYGAHDVRRALPRRRAGEPRDDGQRARRATRRERAALSLRARRLGPRPGLRRGAHRARASRRGWPSRRARSCCCVSSSRRRYSRPRRWEPRSDWCW